MKNFMKCFSFLCLMLLFSGNVYAADYSIFLTTDSGNTLKSGDIIELKAGIDCMVDNFQIDYSQKEILNYY